MKEKSKQKKSILSVSLSVESLKAIQRKALELSLETEKRITVSSLVEQLIVRHIKAGKGKDKSL